MTRNPSRAALFAVLAAVAVFTWSCVDGPSTAVGVAQSVNVNPPKLLGNTLLACTPIGADSVTQSVGTEGGTLFVGPHKLVIPEGALDSTVSITAVAPSDTVNRILFYPEGLTFNEPATLKMSYANCGLLSILIPKYVVYLDGLNIADILSSIDNFYQKRVTTHLEHFSGYAVAW